MAVPRRHLHHRRDSTPDAPEERPLRQLPPLPRRLPDASLPRALSARCAPLHRLPDHRAQRAHPARVPRAMGNRVFGCDDCLAVCPWNKFAERGARSEACACERESDNPPLAELLQLDDAAFRARFAGTPVKRTGRDRFVRNVLIAAGNSGDATLVPQVEALLGDASPLVRAMAVWALSRLAPRLRRRRVRKSDAAARSRRSRARRVGEDRRMSRLFCFGLGYQRRGTGAALAPPRAGSIAGTARDLADMRRALAAQGYEACVFDGAAPAMRGCAGCSRRHDARAHLGPARRRGRSRAAPLSRRDLPRLADARLDRLPLDRRRLWRQARRLGRRDAPAASRQRARKPRASRPRATWLALGEAHGRPAQVFRLAGIYGPGRSAHRQAARRARRGASSSRGRCSTASMSTTSRSVLAASIARPRRGRHLQRHRRRAGAAAGRRRLRRRAAGHRRRRRRCRSRRPISRPWRAASMATTAASPTR